MTHNSQGNFLDIQNRETEFAKSFIKVFVEGRLNKNPIEEFRHSSDMALLGFVDTSRVEFCDFARGD